MKKGILLSVLLFCVCLPTVAVSKETPKKIAIVPFTIYAPSNTHYLKEGIYTMLAARLIWENKIEVMEKDIVKKAALQEKIKSIPTEHQAKELSKKLNADYILYGSVTISDKETSIDASIDARLLDIRNDVSKTFFKQCDSPGKIILKINELTEEINEKVFGHEIKQAGSTSKPASQPGKISVPNVPPLKNSASGPPQVPTTRQLSRLWYSHQLQLETRGLDIGDVDGDGQKELIIIDKHNLWVYRFTDGRLLMVKKKELSSSYLLMAVDLYDLDKDGKDEILLSCIQGKLVASMVLSWCKGKFVTIAQDIPWYLRVMRLAHGGKVILGQKGGEDLPFKPGIFRLAWSERGFDVIERVCSFKDVGIYNCLFADLNRDQVEDILVLNHENYLVLYAKTGGKEWKSTERYYGSFSCVEEKSMDNHVINPLGSIYIPGRMLLLDPEKKSPLEVVAHQNNGLKNFISSELKILSWTGDELGTKWQSSKLYGFITDCQIGDIDNDGKSELVFSLVRPTKNMSSIKAGTTIVAYNLGIF